MSSLISSECTTDICSNDSEYYCTSHEKYVCCQCCDYSHEDCKKIETKTLQDVDNIAKYLKGIFQRMKSEIESSSVNHVTTQQYENFRLQFQKLVGDLICGMADKANADWEQLYLSLKMLQDKVKASS